MRPRQLGVTMLEFTLVVLLFSVLMVAALDRIAALRGNIEQAAVQQTVSAMRSALALHFSELIARGDRQRLAALEGGNALAILRQRTTPVERAGDSGGASDDDRALAGPGQWQYRDGEVVYRPRHTDAFAGGEDAVGRWRVILLGDRHDPRGLDLKVVEPLRPAGAATAQGG